MLWVLEAVVTPNYPRTAFFFNHLCPYPNTDAISVQSVEELDVSDDVFNLTVANTHTFFVGEQPLWVHNCNEKGFFGWLKRIGPQSNGFLEQKLAELDKDRSILVLQSGREPSRVYSGNRTTLFHYTDKKGYEGILKSQEIWSSTGHTHARFGDGYYFSDIDPKGILSVNNSGIPSKLFNNDLIQSLTRLSSTFYNVPYRKNKVSYYIEIDITGLDVWEAIKNDDIRKGTQFIFDKSKRPFDISGRIVSHGKTLKDTH